MNKDYNLEKRTAEFAKSVIRLCGNLPQNSINNRLVGQVVGASGSIGANYREANDALGKKDYNEIRPHSSLDNKTPVEYAKTTAGF